MSKYAPLRDYLATQTTTLIPMTFEQIEKILATPLPPSKKYPAWWSNNPSNNVMTKEWLAAGYETESVDTAGGKLVFRKRETPALPQGGNGNHPNGNSSKTGRAPIFGCMKGTVILNASHDPALPADPDLADWIDSKYGSEAAK